MSPHQDWLLEWLTLSLVILSLVSRTQSTVIIDFISEDLTEIPVVNITSDATHIRLQNNPFGCIPNATFSGLGLTNLYEVNLDSTELTDDCVTRDSFLGLENVRVVSISVCFQYFEVGSYLKIRNQWPDGLRSLKLLRIDKSKLNRPYGHS